MPSSDQLNDATAPPTNDTNAAAAAAPTQASHQRKRRRTSDDLVETQKVDFDLGLNRMRTRGLSRKIQEQEGGEEDRASSSLRYLTRNRRYDDIYAFPDPAARRKPTTRAPKIGRQRAQTIASKSKKQQRLLSQTLATASSSDESLSPSSSTLGLSTLSSSLSSSSSSSSTSLYPSESDRLKPSNQTTSDIFSHLSSLLTAIHNPATTPPDAMIDPSLLLSLRKAMEHIQSLCDGHEDQVEGQRVMAVCEDILNHWVSALVEACEIVDVEVEVCEQDISQPGGMIVETVT